jgi:sugar lactone lactonase YvrE
MTSTRSCLPLALVTLSILAPACGGDVVSDDAAVVTRDDAFVPPGEDAGPAPDDAFSGGADAALDAATSTPDAATTDDAGMTSACGGARPAVSRVTATEGLVIARDGTVYYSQAGAVGRLTPDGMQNDRFVALPRGSMPVWGLALDAANEHLYVGSPGNGTIFDVDLTAASPAPVALVTGAGRPNGLTLGPDGDLYYSDFGGGRVMRVALPEGGAPSMVAAVPSANGVAFDDDGRLLVCDYGGGELVRLTLAGGVEASRETVATRLGSPDGVALDADGTIYVTDNGGGRLLRLAPDGAPTVLRMAIPAAASLEFGAGALDCEDLYVASSGTLARFEMGTVRGRAVPWH